MQAIKCKALRVFLSESPIKGTRVRGFLKEEYFVMVNSSIPGAGGFAQLAWWPENRMNGWNTPLDVYVSPYWLQFTAPFPITHYLLGIAYIGLMTISCIGNGIVIYIFSVAKSLRTPANVFVVGLALTDFLMMAKTPVFIYNSFHLGPVFGNLGCNIYGVIGAYSGIGSAFCNAFIAYDRYRVITCPFSKTRMTKAKAVLLLILLYLYITPFALLPALRLWSKFVPEGYLTSCTTDYFQHDVNGRSYIVSIWFFGWFVPVSVISACYFRIFLSVRDHEHQLREQAKKMNVDSLRSGRTTGETSAEIRIAKAAFCIILLFLFSWVPYIVVSFTAAFSNPSRRLISPLMSMIPALTIKASACFNPFVYAISHPKYREELQKRMPWLCIKEKSTDSPSVPLAEKTPSQKTIA